MEDYAQGHEVIQSSGAQFHKEPYTHCKAANDNIFHVLEKLENIFRVFENAENIFQFFENMENFFCVFENAENFVRVFENAENFVRVFQFGIGEIRKVGQGKIGKKFPNFPSCPRFRPGPEGEILRGLYLEDSLKRQKRSLKILL